MIALKDLKKFEEKRLSSKQRKAMEMLIYQGFKKKEVAEQLKISPATLSNWLNIRKNPDFVEAYEAELECAANLRKRNYNSAAQKAQERLVELSESNDEDIALKAIKEILDRAGDKPQSDMKIELPDISGKLAAVFEQIGGEGLEE